LKELDKLDLWLPPFNKNQRGGKRFIFSSVRLAKILEKGLCGDASFLVRKKNFVGINPVFRMNKFEPGDESFKEHYDTPYYDPNTQVYSKYTMIIYLTEGFNNNPYILNFKNGPSINFISAKDCIIFKQSLKHTGYPYQENSKLFIRTELLYRMKTKIDNPQITNYFNRAVYLTKQSIFQTELDQWANKCYEISNKLHYQLTKLELRTPVLQKIFTFSGSSVTYLTDGSDYYFPTCETEPESYVKECALLAALDFTNALVNETLSFEKCCETKIIGVRSVEDIWNHVQQINNVNRLGTSHIRNKKDAKKIDELKRVPYDVDPVAEIYECCGPDEHTQYDPKVCGEIIAFYNKTHKSMLKEICSLPFLFLGQRVIMNQNLIQTDERFVYISCNDKKIKPINFASCVSGASDPEAYLKTVQTFVGVSLLIPPIEYHVHRSGIKITIQLFYPGWSKPEAKYKQKIHVQQIN
jgi:hypothetical protein